jgi:hypothetical protein
VPPRVVVQSSPARWRLHRSKLHIFHRFVRRRLPLQLLQTDVLQEPFFLDLPTLEVLFEGRLLAVLDGIRHGAFYTCHNYFIGPREQRRVQVPPVGLDSMLGKFGALF